MYGLLCRRDTDRALLRAINIPTRTIYISRFALTYSCMYKLRCNTLHRSTWRAWRLHIPHCTSLVTVTYSYMALSRRIAVPRVHILDAREAEQIEQYTVALLRTVV